MEHREKDEIDKVNSNNSESKLLPPNDAEMVAAGKAQRSFVDIVLDEILLLKNWLSEQNSADNKKGKDAEPNKVEAHSEAENSAHPRKENVSDDTAQRNLAFFADKFRNGVASGFSLVDTAPGVSLYRKGDEFIVSTNLAAGAQIDVVHGDSTEQSRKSAYGGPNPSFARMSPDQALELERKTEPNAIAVVNAEFFANLPRNAVPIAFPLIEDSKVVSEGFASTDKHVGNRLTLVLEQNSARIISFDNKNIEEFRKLQADNAIVSLSPRVNIDGAAASRVGRTFVGLGNPGSDGSYSRVLIFVSPASSQAHAELTLREFGAGPTMMLDGGSSSQFRWKENNYIYPGRTVPNFLSIVPAKK